MKLFVDFWKFNKIWKDLQTQEHRIVFVLIFRCAKQFLLCSPTWKNSQKHVKNQKSTYKHSSFDGLIQEDIDLSDTYLAASVTLIQNNF